MTRMPRPLPQLLSHRCSESKNSLCLLPLRSWCLSRYNRRDADRLDRRGAGLYFAILMKQADPAHEVLVGGAQSRRRHLRLRGRILRRDAGELSGGRSPEPRGDHARVRAQGLLARRSLTSTTLRTSVNARLPISKRSADGPSRDRSSYVTPAAPQWQRTAVGRRSLCEPVWNDPILNLVRRRAAE